MGMGIYTLQVQYAQLAAGAEKLGENPRSTQQVVAFFPTTIRRAFSTMSQLGIRIEY